MALRQAQEEEGRQLASTAEERTSSNQKAGGGGGREPASHYKKGDNPAEGDVVHTTRVKVHLDETSSTHRLITTKPCKSSSCAAKVTRAVRKLHPDNSNVWSFGAATKKAGIIQWILRHP